MSLGVGGWMRRAVPGIFVFFSLPVLLESFGLEHYFLDFELLAPRIKWRFSLPGPEVNIFKKKLRNDVGRQTD